MQKLRKTIMEQVLPISGPMPTIIYNLVQYEAKYNSKTKRFKIALSKIRTSYFRENNLSNGAYGNIDGTSIHWEICDENFIFWLE